MNSTQNNTEVLKKIIINSVLLQKSTASVADADFEGKFLFDFRKILLNPQYLDLIAETLWSTLEKEYPFQICGLESAAIPLVTAIVMKSIEKNKPVNGFYIRKSRKKYDLRKIIEGDIHNEKIIIVDDLINSGSSILRQVTLLQSLGKKVSHAITIVRFREMEYYYFLKEQGVELNSIFLLTDFGLNFLKTPAEEKFLGDAFSVKWYFKSEKPNYFYVVPKSAPAIDNDRVYFGSDNGN